MLPKKFLGIDVLSAANRRIATVFDEFDKICVSFSGGKDSSVMMHLVMEEAIKRDRKIGVLFIDWEAQYKLTINHVKEMFDLYKDYIDPYWVALPLRTVNAVSMIEPEWTCWDPTRLEDWVRDLPAEAITDTSYFPFYSQNMTFEEFVPAFGKWYAGGNLTACMVGIRATESLNRFRTIVRFKSKFNNLSWTTYIGDGCAYNAYPIYDWRTEDIWTYIARTGKPYNKLYDRMHQAGLSIHQMRICEPYGDEQRKGLWLFHVIEPETWGKICARVAGANSGALYAQESGNILGNFRITKPDHFTWEQYANFLLNTMPPPTAEHYKDKIAGYINYCANHWVQYRNGLPETQPGDTGGSDIPSWRRICKTLLRHDYWCKALSYSPTKTYAYQKYRKMMDKRRRRWGIYDPSI